MIEITPVNKYRTRFRHRTSGFLVKSLINKNFRNSISGNNIEIILGPLSKFKKKNKMASKKSQHSCN